ncbi:TadE/TadG family type IV pilus assembly protein [Candidatus Riflebacteria bacterium]
MFEKRRFKNYLHRKGQALVELAIMTPFLLILLFTVIDFGLIYHAKLTIVRIGRDTGMLYSSRPDVTSGEMVTYAETRKPNSSVWRADTLNWTGPTPVAGSTTGEITFKISFKWPLYTPVLRLLARFFGDGSNTDPTIPISSGVMQYSKGT